MGDRGRSSTDMFGKIILVLSVLAWASAQIPNIGFCPEYIPMPNFNLQKVSNLIILIRFYFIRSNLIYFFMESTGNYGDNFSY